MSLNSFISTSRKIMRGDAGVDGDAQRIAQLTWLLFLKVYDAKEADWEFHNPAYQSIIPKHSAGDLGHPTEKTDAPRPVRNC
mgnify:CR=1 FL=1